MKRVHLLSRMYPKSGWPMCRCGATPKQETWTITTNIADVTCHRCKRVVEALRREAK